MRREEARDGVRPQRIGDPQVRHRGVRPLQRPPVFGELPQRRCEPVGVARRHRARGIGEVLALPRDRRLHRAGEQGRDDRGHDPEDQEEQLGLAVAAAAAAAEEGDPQEHVGEDADRDDEPEDDERDPDVVVADVAELMPEHAIELAIGHELEKAGRDGDRRLLGLAARREGVRRGVIHDVELRHRRCRWRCTGSRPAGSTAGRPRRRDLDRARSSRSPRDRRRSTGTSRSPPRRQDERGHPPVVAHEPAGEQPDRAQEQR